MHVKVHFPKKLVANFSYIFDSFTLISSRVLVLPKVCRLIYFMKKKKEILSARICILS